MSEHNPTTGPERAMWKALQEHDRLTLADIQSLAGVTQYQLEKYTGRLRRLGILMECGRERRCTLFTIRDREAAEMFAKRKRNTKEGSMWAIIRALKAFTPNDIAMTLVGVRGDITDKHIQKYCRNLLKSGYLRVISKANIGVTEARYQLVKDTGPLPPQVKRLEVIVDGNDDRAVYVEGARL